MIDSILKFAKEIQLTCGNCFYFKTNECDEHGVSTERITFKDRPCSNGLLIQLLKNEVVFRSGELVLVKPIRFLSSDKTKQELYKTFDFSNTNKIEELILYVKAKAAEIKEPEKKQKLQNPENPELIRKATELLKDPEILNKFIEHQNRFLIMDNPIRKLLLLACVSAYGTYPLNVALMQVFSSGKSTNAINTAKYFANTWFLGGLSPKSLIHEKGDYDEEQEGFIIDLQKKIILFLDEPQYETLTMLKPLLSHDRFETEYKFVDKLSGQTVKAILKGWPSVIFCSPKSKYTLEYCSRWLTASPQTSTEKISKVIKAKGEKASQTEQTDPDFATWQQAFKLLSQQAPLKVIVPYAKELAECFRAKRPIDMRFFDLFLALIKANTILHALQRQKDENNNLTATIQDYNQAYDVFHEIEKSTTLGLGQNILDFFQNVIMPIWQERKGLTSDLQIITIEDLIWKYKETTEESISRSTLRETYLKPLEQKGLIDIEDDTKDKRKKTITVKSTIPETSLINETEFAKKYCCEGRVEIHTHTNRVQIEPLSLTIKSDLPLPAIISNNLDSEKDNKKKDANGERRIDSDWMKKVKDVPP